jgi:hypothetical protein
VPNPLNLELGKRVARAVSIFAMVDTLLNSLSLLSFFFYFNDVDFVELFGEEEWKRYQIW